MNKLVIGYCVVSVVGFLLLVVGVAMFVDSTSKAIANDIENRCKNISELKKRESKYMDYKCYLKSKGGEWQRIDVY